MILIISTCKEELSELEFVRPIEQLIKECKTVHFKKVTIQDIDRADKIIIAGTALKDFDYLTNFATNWTWLKTTRKPVLGICAGMQIILQTFENTLFDVELIGPKEVNVIKENKLARSDFSAYFLATKASRNVSNFEVLAVTNKISCMIKHKEKEIYGCLFHPEVLNESIITNFNQLRVHQ